MMNNDDKLRQFVQRANMEPGVNGAQVAPEVRPTQWSCPRCGTPAAQAAEPVNLGGQTLGYKYLVDEVGEPSPLSVIANEVIERDQAGNVIKEYRTYHCLNCFNHWQRRKMMEEIRANVPQLVRKPDAESHRS